MMENTLIRSAPCVECGAEMLWTQNVWHENGVHGAAYRCSNGHVIDPAMTRQCPACGVHDTAMLADEDGRQQYKCLRCGESFQVPR